MRRLGLRVVDFVGVSSDRYVEREAIGKWVMEYDPRADPPILRFTDDPAAAATFATAVEALECWNQSNGRRPDGRPNRPLTAFSVEVLHVA